MLKSLAGFLSRPRVPTPPLLRMKRCLATQKHKKMLKFAKGYVGRANRCYRVALNRVQKAWLAAFRGRKEKKRAMRKLWISRINAGSRIYGVPYNRLIAGLNNSNVELNRNVLANLAVTEPLSFKSVVDVVCVHDPYLSTRHLRPRTASNEDVLALLHKFGVDDGDVDWDDQGQWDDEIPALSSDDS
mmetsp:Transcript_893/g.2518  ORF Transcript_893/g.2518 Transcript_893/m.2518 type:complete len:187 (+) Transcript_893:33-593(+)